MLTLRGSRGPRCGAELNDLGVIPDGAVLVRDGVLQEVGPTRRIENLALARTALEINAAGRVLMPGFVDSHTHLLFPPPGGAESAADLARAVRATTAQRLEMRARAHLEAMARHGTTTVEVKSGCGPDESAETKILRVLSSLKRDHLDVVPTFLFRLPEGSGEEALHEAAEWTIRELLPKIRRRRLARFADILWNSDGPEPYRDFVRLLEAARGMGFGCKLHLERRRSEAALTAAVERFAVTVDHLEHAAPSDARLLAGSCTMATLLPCASFHSGRGDAPARALIDAGAAVAIASNFNPQHTPTLNMQTAMALGCLRMGMTAAEAISAATINGAHAVGRADHVGSLEPGKVADLLILNAPDYRDLARDFGMNLVHMTMKRGECIYTEGEVSMARRPAQVFPEPVRAM